MESPNTLVHISYRTSLLISKKLIFYLYADTCTNMGTVDFSSNVKLKPCQLWA